ncbi:MAG: YihY/virulence factor BrkB family protein, partial [Acidobacteriota bacterium]|nr:YihY/virulence factor BrkB family protein [Acidobacteriota bacterium]
MPPLLKNLPYLLKRTLLASMDDGCFGIAKGAAYSALLSFFPVLTSAAAILVTTKADFVARSMSQFLTQVVPPGTENLVVEQFRMKGQRSALLLVIAALTSLWAASSVIKSLMEGFHAAYRTPRSRSFVRESAVAIYLVFLAAIPLVGASALVLFGGEVERIVLVWLRVDPVLNPISELWELLSRIARYVIAFGATVALTTTLYYFGPYRKQRWSKVWPGAVLATVLWLGATAGFAWYVRHMSNYNVMYGSIGTSIALLVWMYLMAVIAILG